MSFNLNRLGASRAFIASSTPPSTSTTPSSGHTLHNLSTASQSQAQNPAPHLNINNMQDIQTIIQNVREQHPNITEQKIFTALTRYIEKNQICKHPELDNVLSTWAINIFSGKALPELPPQSLNNNTQRPYDELIAEVAKIAQAAKRQ